MADTDTIAAAIAKVKSKKTKKTNPKGKAGANGDGKTAGKGKTALNKAAGAGTSKRGAQGSSLRGAALSNPVVPIVQQRATKARVIPLAQKVKYVFDLAKARRTPLQYEVFKSEKGVDIEGALLEALQKHSQLVVDEIGHSVTYRPKYALSCKDEVNQLIRQHPFGLLSAEIADAYPDARKHMDELLEDNAIFECGSTESPSSIVYPNFYKPPGGLPEENIRNILFDVEMPQSQDDIDSMLMKAGIAKAKRSTARLKMAVIQDDRKPVKEKKRTKLRKVTNTHMEHELFNDDMPGAIDR